MDRSLIQCALPPSRPIYPRATGACRILLCQLLYVWTVPTWRFTLLDEPAEEGWPMSTPHFPGWYPDPDQPGRERLWDGQAWTHHLRKAAGTGRLSPRRLPSRSEAVCSDSSSHRRAGGLGFRSRPNRNRAPQAPASSHQRSRHPVHQRPPRNWLGFRLSRDSVWPKRSASCARPALTWATLIADRPAKGRAPF